MELSRQAELALLAVCALWGGSFTVAKDGLRFASPMLFTAWRKWVATLVLALYYRDGLQLRHVRGGLVVGFFMFAGFTLQTYGLALIAASRNAFLTALCIPLTPVVQCAVFWRRPRGREALSVAVALVGTYYLTRPGGSVGRDGGGADYCGEASAAAAAASAAASALSRGDWLTLGSAVAFAFHIVAMNHYAAEGEAFKTVAVVQLGTTCLLSALLYRVSEAACYHPEPRFWGDVLACGLLASALAFSVFTWAQKHISATRSAVICSSESVFSAITAYLVKGETMSRTNVCGGALIVIAVVAGEMQLPPPPPWLPAALRPLWQAAQGEAEAESAEAPGGVELGDRGLAKDVAAL